MILGKAMEIRHWIPAESYPNAHLLALFEELKREKLKIKQANNLLIKE